MDNIEKLSYDINVAIKNSDMHRAYIVARDRLNEHPDLANRLNEFKYKNAKLQSENANPFDQVQKLQKEYADLLNVAVVSDFVRAEQRLCRSLKAMYETIADGVM